MGFWSRWTFGYRLSLGFVVTLVVPSLVAGAAILFTRIDRLNVQAEDAAVVLAELKAAEVSSVEARLQSEVEALVFEVSTFDTYQEALRASQEELDAFDVRRVLREVLVGDPSIFHVRLYSNRYLGVIAQEGSETGALSPVGDISSVQHTTVSNVYLGRRDTPMLDIVVPIRDSDDPSQVLGHVVVTQNQLLAGQGELPSLFKVFESQPNIQDMPDAYVGLFDKSGILIASSVRSQNTFDDFSTHPALPVARHTEVIQDRYESTVLDEGVIGAYLLVGESDWVLVIELSEAEVVQPVLAETLPLVAVAFGAIILLNSLWNWNLYRTLALPLRRLAHRANIFALSDRSTVIPPIHRYDEVASVQNAVAQLTEQVFAVVEQMRRTNRRQERYLSLLHRISDLVQEAREERFLLEDILRLLGERMEQIDYVQLFVVDAGSNLLTFKLGSGEVGRRLLAQQYRVPLSTDSVVGRAALSGQSIVLDNRTQQMDVYRTELLDKMQGEVVIPIRTKDRVIGVLDIHSYQTDAFVDEDVTLFETVASQLGVFLIDLPDHVRPDPLLAEGQQGWHEYYMQRRVTSLAAQVGLGSSASEWTSLQEEAMQTGEVKTETIDDKITFAVPVKLRDQVLGAVEWTVEAHRFNQDFLQTAVELVDRLALAIDNARLFEQSRRLVARERLVNEISRKLTTQTDVRQILQVAVRELGQALGTPETQISLNISETN